MVLDGVAAGQYSLKGDFKEVNAIWRAHRAFFAEKKNWASQRKVTGVKKPTAQLTGWYPQSVVWQYFIKGRKTFKSLNVPDSAALSS